MEITVRPNLPPSAAPRVSWREVAWPREHGSWSLAFEPIVLGLFVAPSVPGGLLALALTAGFFARRPLRIAFQDRNEERQVAARFALNACALVAVTAMSAAVALAGAAWLVWLLPPALAGAVFARFDLRGAGREEAAEIAGATAFALVPAAFVALAGGGALEAIALASLMLGRAVPSVMTVRACLRAAKTGERRDAPALTGALVALAATTGLFCAGAVPVFALAGLVLFAARTWALLVFPRPALRARTLGMAEAILGVLFVAGLGATWVS